MTNVTVSPTKCGGDGFCDGSCRIFPATLDDINAATARLDVLLDLPVTETWGAGDGEVFALLGDRFALAGIEFRGVWPPDTRVAGLLTCCGQSEHPVECPQWR